MEFEEMINFFSEKKRMHVTSKAYEFRLDTLPFKVEKDKPAHPR